MVRWLPEKTAYNIFDFIGTYTLNRSGKSVQRLRSNLKRVTGLSNGTELDDLVSRAMSSYMRYWCDTFRSPDWSPQRIIETVTCTNEEYLTGPMQRGEGVIVALPHAGNWDHAGSYFCTKGFPLVTVAEVLKPIALFKKFLKYRENIGMEVIGLDSRSIVTLLQRTKEKRLIALVADRDLSKNGVDVDFFGHKARMPAGPAVLALRTGVPLITAFVSYTPVGIHINFEKVEIPSQGEEGKNISIVVQRCADNFEKGIALHPQDWHMLQRIWIDTDFTERAS
jgi:KDO2-lipid IV(A) lauroyltransferase